MRLIKLVCITLLVFQASAAKQASKTESLSPKQTNGKWGYANKRGDMVIQPQFDIALPFSDGLARVGRLDKESSKDKTQPSYKWGYIDERGRIVVELQYAALRDFSEGLAAAAIPNMNKEEKRSYRDLSRHKLRWGYVDRNGQIVIPMNFLYAGDFSENLAHVDVGTNSQSMCERTSKFGYIDKTGAFIIEAAFASAEPFHNGEARVSKGRICYVGRCLCCAPRFFGSYGRIDKKGIFTSENPADSQHLSSAPCFDN